MLTNFLDRFDCSLAKTEKPKVFPSTATKLPSLRASAKYTQLLMKLGLGNPDCLQLEYSFVVEF